MAISIPPLSQRSIYCTIPKTPSKHADASPQAEQLDCETLGNSKMNRKIEPNLMRCANIRC